MAVSWRRCTLLDIPLIARVLNSSIFLKRDAGVVSASQPSTSFSQLSIGLNSASPLNGARRLQGSALKPTQVSEPRRECWALTRALYARILEGVRENPQPSSDCGANNGHALFTVAGNPARPWFQRDVDPARLAKGQERLDKKLAAARARAAELAARNAALPLGDRHYACILDDPPWRYHFPREIGPEVHYATMSDDEILAFHLRGIAQLAAPDCALFLWTVDAKLELAFAVIQACGFQYRTRAFDWVKTTKDGNGLASGFGHHWTVPGSESCLLATRGNPVRLHADVQQVILAPRREHSRKPDEVAARIERLVPGPYIELFARSPREGWAAWGNEAADAEDDDD